MDDGQVAQQFLDGAADQYPVGAGAQFGELVGVLQQCQGAQRDHVRGGLVAGDKEQACHDGQLALAQFTGADALDGQPREQVVGGVRELVSDQAVQVVGERFLGVPGHLGRGVPVNQHFAGALKETVVGVRHTQQMANHQGGHGQREGLHQIHRVRAGQHLVDQVVHEPLNGRAQCLDPLDHERGGHHPAQPGMLGVVHVDEGPPDTTTCPHAGVLVGKAGQPGVRAEPRVGQQRTLVGVAGHQPRVTAVPQPHPGDRCLRPQRPQRRRRIKRAARGTRHRVLGKVGPRLNCRTCCVAHLILLAGKLTKQSFGVLLNKR
jgi:hypothetical protein